MEKELCELKHKRIDELFKTHERRINNHSERIDIIENNNSRMDERMAGLITQLGALNTTLKWFIGLMVGGFVGLFFNIIQKGIM